MYNAEQGRFTKVGSVLSFSAHGIGSDTEHSEEDFSLITTKTTKQTVWKAVVLSEYLLMNVKHAAGTTVLELLWIQLSLYI